MCAETAVREPRPGPPRRDNQTRAPLTNVFARYFVGRLSSSSFGSSLTTRMLLMSLRRLPCFLDDPRQRTISVASLRRSPSASLLESTDSAFSCQVRPCIIFPALRNVPVAQLSCQLGSSTPNRAAMTPSNRSRRSFADALDLTAVRADLRGPARRVSVPLVVTGPNLRSTPLKSKSLAALVTYRQHARRLLTPGVAAVASIVRVQTVACRTDARGDPVRLPFSLQRTVISRIIERDNWQRLNQQVTKTMTRIQLDERPASAFPHAAACSQELNSRSVPSGDPRGQINYGQPADHPPGHPSQPVDQFDPRRGYRRRYWLPCAESSTSRTVRRKYLI